MRMKKISLEVFLDDDLAEWVETQLSNPSFSSEIAYYLGIKQQGGYVVTTEQLDSIIDNLIDEDDDDSSNANVNSDELTGLIKSTLENTLKEQLSELLKNAPVIATQLDLTPDKVETEEPVFETNVVEFSSAAYTDSDEEQMSDDELDDLADMFGF